MKRDLYALAVRLLGPERVAAALAPHGDERAEPRHSSPIDLSDLEIQTPQEGDRFDHPHHEIPRYRVRGRA